MSELGFVEGTYRQKLNLVDDLKLDCYSYSYIEDIVHKYGFLHTCGSLFKNKKVLLISGFASTLKMQYVEKKDLLFSTYFEKHPLETKSIDYIDTPITVCSQNLQNGSFIKTLEDIKKQIQSKDFDVAFLACGAYAVPLGLYIKKDLKKQAIYIGGILQVMFGVLGRRFQGTNYCVKNEHWINAPINILSDGLQQIIKNGVESDEYCSPYF
jgi:hypothetical protein